MNYNYFYPYLDDNVMKNAKKQKHYYNKIPKHEFEQIDVNEYNNINLFLIKNLSSAFTFLKNNMIRHHKNIKNSKLIEIELISDKCFMFNNIDFLINDDLNVIDDVILNALSITYKYKKDLKKKIMSIIKNTKYIFISAELFYGDKLFSTGQTFENYNFIKKFLLKSINNYVLNTQNIILFYKEGIKSNYYPSYDSINVNLPIVKNKNIDVLFYGNNPKTGIFNFYVFNHRNTILNNLKQYGIDKNINVQIYDNLYDKDEILSQTKIVLQIPNYKNFHSYPWAKTFELMNKKVFFIIEENEEMYIQKLDKYVVFYKRNNLNNLYELIEYYLNNEDKRDEVINKCYKYSKHKLIYNIFKVL
jgi:hypothetical protein